MQPPHNRVRTSNERGKQQQQQQRAIVNNQQAQRRELLNFIFENYNGPQCQQRGLVLLLLKFQEQKIKKNNNNNKKARLKTRMGGRIRIRIHKMRSPSFVSICVAVLTFDFRWFTS